MKRRILLALLVMTIFILLTGCGTSKDLELSSVGYTTITEGFDWGPAITKVILNLGATMDSNTLSTSTFKVSSVREYPVEEKIQTTTKERKVLAVYVSDSSGNETTDGTYVTIEMEVGASITAGSPFYYTRSNNYVETSYIIELVDTNLKTAEGGAVTMTVTDKSGYQGNTTLIADDFDQSGIYKQDDITLLYASYIPKTASTDNDSNPLIIWLHGGGEGGTDPSIALIGNKVVNLATDSIQSYFGETGAYILVPQSPTMWMDYDGTRTMNHSVKESNGRSYYTESLMGLIEKYVENHPEIDKNRIYIGGCSNGGYMTMNMITTYPDYFTAAFPVCEAFSDEWLTEEKLASIVDMPIWLTHAKNDYTVKIYERDNDGNLIAIDDFSNAAYNRLIAAGAKNVYYSLFENVVDMSGKYFSSGTSEPVQYQGHFSWIYVLNNDCTQEIDGKQVSIFEWLAKQSK